MLKEELWSIYVGIPALYIDCGMDNIPDLASRAPFILAKSSTLCVLTPSNMVHRCYAEFIAIPVRRRQRLENLVSAAARLWFVDC